MPCLIKGSPTSTKIAEQTFFSSSAFSIMLVILYTWSIVECLLRNPNLCFGIRFFLSMIGFSLLISNFSKSYDITGSNEMGLYNAASCGGSSGFGIVTSATFHSLGTYFSRKAALIMLVIFNLAFLGSCCRTSPVMRSNPATFFFWGGGLCFYLFHYWHMLL